MAQYYSICKVKLKKKSIGFFFNRAVSFVQWQINIHIFFGRLLAMYFMEIPRYLYSAIL